MAEETKQEFVRDQKKAEVQSSAIRIVNQKQADKAMDVSIN